MSVSVKLDLLTYKSIVIPHSQINFLEPLRIGDQEHSKILTLRRSTMLLLTPLRTRTIQCMYMTSPTILRKLKFSTLQVTLGMCQPWKSQIII